MWIKNNQNPTPQIAFNKIYEPCIYGTIGNPYLKKNLNNINEVLNKEIGSGNQVHDEILEIIDLWIIKRDNTQDYKHPTQKPVGLMEPLIRVSSNAGELILDPFLGSGTTAVACKNLKRNFLGFDMVQKYIDIANGRLAQKSLWEIAKE